MEKPADSPARFARLSDFFNEVGMLRHTPRSGYAFLGSGKENVAEHSYRTSVIGFALAKMCGADVARVTFMCLFHDLHEARTGDFNYVNHIYDSCNARKALEDATEGTGLENDILGLWDELCQGSTLESQLARDADQLDLILNLNTELGAGNEFARDWLENALERLITPQARDMAEAILRTSHYNWWYGRVDKNWWINRNAK